MNGTLLSLWTTILHLPHFVVVHGEIDEHIKTYFFTVRPDQSMGVCPHCGNASNEVHQTRTQERIMDLPIGEYFVELKVRVPQYKCHQCRCCFTPPVPFLAEGAHATERFLERVSEMIRHSDLASVANLFGLSEQTLARWYYPFVERRLNSNQPCGRPGTVIPKPIRKIGIDELSLKKSIGNGLP